MITTKSLLIPLTLAVLSSASAQAAEPSCKGMDASSCAADNACAWVPGYTRKDGINVRSYCRTTGKGSKIKAKVSALAPGKD